ncbi:S8 family peptidase [Plantactinospora sp. KLBMP9567]|uniref:S8 family peptidase n=1 Tax=Plantactinospora sp. KLBMP9567 TaxID=3085900 RepID=UPI002981A854|nr:S8 family serine peptidase [Plantactinospora sp. KLBMP9567]MDW5325057.1 S8 family serine peptidase [Plantactinospora sp. KLBMP9567]
MTIEWLPDGAVSPVVAGHDGWFRPDELLVGVEVEPDLPDLLDAADVVAEPYVPGHAPWRDRVAGPDYGDVNERLATAEAGHRLWTVTDRRGRDLPDLVAALRARGASVQLNHVFVGEDWYHGGPGDRPRPVLPPTQWPLAQGEANGTAHVAILDTAMPPQWRELPGDLRALVVERFPVPDRIGNPLDEDEDGRLDRQAGHGYFICGLVGRVAPAAGVAVSTVLHASGEGDEARIALALLEEATAPIVNLSLGGYTEGDIPPAALITAVRRILAAGRVVVAAAGNDGESANRAERPFWPAAIKGVVAVGAYQTIDGRPVPAPFSNRGPWVDVYAPGVRLRSAYIDGHEDEAGSPFAGWASWSGTSFAAPLFAAELARRLIADPAGGTVAAHRDRLLAELPPVPWPGLTGRLLPAGDIESIW